MKKLLSLTFVAATALGAGCAMDLEIKPDADDTKGGADGKAEGWGSSDNPSFFNNNLEYDLTKHPQTGEAQNIPWAGNYWPTYQDNINHKWNGASSKAPSTKYGEAFGITGVEDAVSKNHGIDNYASRTKCTTNSDCDDKLAESCAKREGKDEGVCIPTWWGICHAWAPVSILAPEPKHPVTHNGVEFKVNDIKALVTLAYNRTETKFVSLRCNENDGADEINYDNYGRPTGTSASCRDTNPGTFHVLMTNYLGIQKESFVYDRTFDYQVWNQPLRGYRITKQQEVSALEANKLIGVTATGGSTTEASGTVAKNEWRHEAAIAVTAGDTLSITMTGTGDADLYAKFGSQPTANAYDCRPYDNGSAETCDLTVPAGATQLFVSVHGYAETSNFTVKTVAGGSIPTKYQFNDKAAKLYQMHMDVDYISESSASTDGNLGSTIDRYTHTDRYDYILELDADGKVIGGEWLFASKRAHPDFVWLPIRHRDQSVAGGKIKFADVKMLLDLSVAEPGGGGGTGEVKTVADAGTVKKSEWKHYGPYDVAPGKTLTATLSGTGDADLYVRKSAAPTAASYDCRPYKNGSSEACTVTGPGKLYVAVNGYATTSDFDVLIEYTEGTGSTPPVEPPATVTHLDVADSVASGESKLFTLDVQAGRKVVIRTFAPNDVDLYIQMGVAPTVSAYLMRAWTTSGNETIAYTPTTSGKLHILVDGYAASQFTLRTADQ